MSIVSLPLQIIILLFKFGSASHILSFAFSVLSDIFESSFNVIFLLTSLPLGHLHPFHHNHFPHLCCYVYLLYVRSSGSIFRVSQKQAVLTFILMVSYFFCNFISFTSYVILPPPFFFICMFIFVGQFPFLMVCFCKMLCGFVTGRQERNTPYTLCCLFVDWITDIQYQSSTDC